MGRKDVHGAADAARLSGRSGEDSRAGLTVQETLFICTEGPGQPLQCPHFCLSRSMVKEWTIPGKSLCLWPCTFSHTRELESHPHFIAGKLLPQRRAAAPHPTHNSCASVLSFSATVQGGGPWVSVRKKVGLFPEGALTEEAFQRACSHTSSGCWVRICISICKSISKCPAFQKRQTKTSERG